MTKTLQELRVERRALVEQLIRELDSLAGGQSRSVSILAGYAAKLDSKTWTAHDLDEISLAGDRIVSYAAGSDVVIDRMVDEVRRISAEIDLLKANQPIDPPTPIDPGTPTGFGRPGEDLDWGVLPCPDEADLDWIAEGSTITSQKGLGTVNAFGTAYRMSRAAGVEAPSFGIKGTVLGDAAVGGQYGHYGDHELMYAGEATSSATFVGLTDDANAHISFGSHFQSVIPTGTIRCYNLGIRSGGPSGHHGNAAKGAEHVVYDGCWWVHYDLDHDYSENENWTFLHSQSLGNVGTLVWRNHKWRGLRPTDPGLRFLYYSVCYAHGQTESFLFENNDCRGGGRGGHQNRPEAWAYGAPTDRPRPTARVMYRGNTHTSDGPGGDGGQCVGAWSALGGMYVYDNDFEDFPFTGVMTSGQTPQQNYPTPSGNQIPFLHFSGNRIIPGPNTRRVSINLSSIDTIHIYDDNEIEGQVQFDAYWNYDKNGSMIGEIKIHADAVPEWLRGAKHYAVGKGKTVLYTNAELTAMLTT